MSNERILFICGASETIINFRKSLILYLKKKSFEISVIVGDELRKKEIISLGINMYCVPHTNRDTNIFSKIRLKKRFYKVIKTVNPGIVFTFQTTANLFGVPAAKKAKISNIFSMVEGLGDPFQPVSFVGKVVERIVSSLYKKSFKNVKRVFFLNNDDKQEFVDRKIVKKEQVIIIHGIGIDVDSIKPNLNLPKEKRVVCLSRLVKNKGIFEYCKIARIVRKTRKDIIFELYGEEQQIKAKDLKEYVDDGSVIYRGYTKEPLNIIRKARVVASCSFYREGFPMVVMEAAALGKPIVAYNTVGYRDSVEDGLTGFLVTPHNLEEFAKIIISLIDDDERLLKIGTSSRSTCETKYNSNSINEIVYLAISR